MDIFDSINHRVYHDELFTEKHLEMAKDFKCYIDENLFTKFDSDMIKKHAETMDTFLLKDAIEQYENRRSNRPQQFCE